MLILTDRYRDYIYMAKFVDIIGYNYNIVNTGTKIIVTFQIVPSITLNIYVDILLLAAHYRNGYFVRSLLTRQALLCYLSRIAYDA